MFNTACYYLNFVNPAIPERLRFIVRAIFWKEAKEWKYPQLTAGYVGGIDVPGFGTVAFRSDDGELSYKW